MDWCDVPKTMRNDVAKEARKLAFKYLNGKGPRITNSQGYNSCLAGELVRASYLPHARVQAAIALDDLFVSGLLTNATSEYACDILAPVFPLLAVADPLDEL